MRVLLFFLLTFVCASVSAEDFYWTVLNGAPYAPDNYPSADAACQAEYYNYFQMFVKYNIATATPYEAPYPTIDQQSPDSVAYLCPVTLTFNNGQPATPGGAILLRHGTGCPDGQAYNPQSGKCEAPTDDQDRKEEGDQSDGLAGNGSGGVVSGVVVSCDGVVTIGNPINAGAGNKFQTEKDYQDTDGELRFVRYYNGKSGQWRHSYAASLFSDPAALVLTFEDGHSSLFSLSNGVATAEATERGSLTQINSQWVYNSPANEQLTFDVQGRLIRWQQANGLAQTLTYVVATNGDVTATVTDSRGHTFQFTETRGHAPKSFTAITSGGTFTYNAAGQLTTVTRSWLGHTATRTYLYEDTRNVSWLTGIIDERGVRYATWAYDAQGRAVSSQHASGAEKVTLTYNTDGSTTATNALGNTTVYQYQVIQGVKRVTAIQGSPAQGCPASNSSYTYYPNGQVQTKTDALGNITTFTYDTLGRELTRVEAKGTPQERTTTTTWWDATHFLPKTVTTPDRVTTYTYDTQGRLQSTSVHSIKG